MRNLNITYLFFVKKKDEKSTTHFYLVFSILSPLLKRALKTEFTMQN